MAGRGDAAGVRERAPARATDREVVVVDAVLVAGSEKAAAHRLGLSHSTVKHHLANARSKVGATPTAQLVWMDPGRRADLQLDKNDLVLNTATGRVNPTRQHPVRSLKGSHQS